MHVRVIGCMRGSGGSGGVCVGRGAGELVRPNVALLPFIEMQAYIASYSLQQCI